MTTECEEIADAMPLLPEGSTMHEARNVVTVLIPDESMVMIDNVAEALLRRSRAAWPAPTIAPEGTNGPIYSTVDGRLWRILETHPQTDAVNAVCRTVESYKALGHTSVIARADLTPADWPEDRVSTPASPLVADRDSLIARVLATACAHCMPVAILNPSYARGITDAQLMIAAAFSSALGAINPRFDRDAFMAAACPPDQTAPEPKLETEEDL